MNGQTPPDLQSLYAKAFEEFGAVALWNKRRLVNPTRGDALVVARALRTYGPLDARKLAEAIEAVCHAAV